jgi:hypothetical protein
MNDKLDDIDIKKENTLHMRNSSDRDLDGKYLTNYRNYLKMNSIWNTCYICNCVQTMI